MSIAASSPPPPPSIVYYVSSSGDDRASGSVDHPFATLERARDQIRSLRAADHERSAEASIVVLPGLYVRRKPFELTEADSGVDLRGLGHDTRLTGGFVIPAFEPLHDPLVERRLSAAARSHIVVAALPGVETSNVGTVIAQGFGRPIHPSSVELFFRDQPMQLARWPNRGQFAVVRTADGGSSKSAFYVDPSRAARWKSGDIWVHGYWFHDWADSDEKIRAIGRDGRVDVTSPGPTYGFRNGQRFYFLNVLEELDEPGEYFIDSRTRKLYFWPPETPRAGDAVVSVMDQPLIRVRGASDIEISGFTLDSVRGDALQINDSLRVSVRGCLVQNSGNRGVVIRRSVDITLEDSEIRGTGHAAIDVDSGDRLTLMSGRIVIRDNELHHFARLARTYQPGVMARGVGITIAHNRIYDAPHSAVIFSGNEMSILDNEIYDVCLETGDAGAIYSGRDYSFRGNKIVGNSIHHVFGVGVGAIAIYLDDCLSGTLVESNTLWQVRKGILLGGGRDSRIERNVCIECETGMSADSRCATRSGVAYAMVYSTMLPALKAVRWSEPPYRTRYPDLRSLAKYFDDPSRPPVPAENNATVNNVAIGGYWMSTASADPSGARHNLVRPVDDVAIQRGEPHFKAGSPVPARGFSPQPGAGAGLEIDAFRKSLPARRLLAASVAVTQISTTRAGTFAEIRYTLRNLGDTTETGSEILFLGADNTESNRIGSFSYRLTPYSSNSRIIRLPVTASRLVSQLAEYRVGADGPHRVFEIDLRQTE